MILFIFDAGYHIKLSDNLPIIVYDFIFNNGRPSVGGADVYWLSKDDYGTVLAMIDTYK